VSKLAESLLKGGLMPVISRFLGIIIAIYWDDHAPPHFHAKYGEYEITVNIVTGVVEGKISKKGIASCP
jgi:hypothetical protein